MSFNPSGSTGTGAIHTDSDVALSNPANAQILSYNASLSKWQNQTLSSTTLATTTLSGATQLAGDLGGTSSLPNVLRVNNTIISGAPSAGQVITASNTNAASWTNPTFSNAQLLTATSVKSTAYTAAPGNFIPVDTTGGAVTISLPTVPIDKSQVAIKKIDGSAFAVNIAAGGSDVFNTIGGPATLLLSLQNQSINLQYSLAQSIWYVTDEGQQLAQLDNRYSKQGSLFINVKEAPYSAKGDGTTDDTSAIQNAINAASALGGGTVYIPIGIYLHSGLVLNNFVSMLGAGMHATTLKLANGANTHSITVYCSPNNVIANAEVVSVSHLMIDGNKANQTSTSHGVYSVVSPTFTAATNDWDFDVHNYFEHLFIYNAKTTGLYNAGRGECRYNNVQVYQADNYGFYIGQSDAFYYNCSSEKSGFQGWVIQQSSVRLTNCKSIMSGQVWHSSNTTPNNYSGGTGFEISYVSGIELSGCEAQDNRGQGYGISSAYRCVLSGCVADSNSTSGAGLYPAFDIYISSYVVINGVAWERAADGTHSYQTNALRIRSTSNYNDITLTHSGLSPGVVGAATSSDTVLLSNRVVVNGTNINGSILQWASVKTGAYTANTYDAVICNTTNGTFAVTLPAPTGTNGMISIKWRTGSTPPTILTATGRTIDPTWPGFTQLGGVVMFSDDGTYWNTI